MLSAAFHRQREASAAHEKHLWTLTILPSKFDFDAEHKTMCTSSLRDSSISVCNCASAATPQTSLHSAIPTVLYIYIYIYIHATLWKWYHPNFYGMSCLTISPFSVYINTHFSRQSQVSEFSGKTILG